MIPHPVWSDDELEEGRTRAIEIFREERTVEPLEAYLEAFEDYQGVVEDLLETTLDLTDFENTALDVLTDSKMLHAFRYIPGPPISLDDLKVLADSFLSATRLRADPTIARRIVDIVLAGLDRKRFPWVSEKREPTEAERNAAVLASAALMAMRKVETERRGESKTQQEERVERVLLDVGFSKVATRKVETLALAPRVGEFCRESLLGIRKADFIVGLWDSRIMPIECKVSNSSPNSVKRLNNDAAAKAGVWIRDFGDRNVVPAAVLSGVYKLHNLLDAQNRGLSLFWAHELQQLTEWIATTRSNA